MANWAIIIIHRLILRFLQRWENVVKANVALGPNVKVGRHTYGINQKTISIAPSLNPPVVEIGSFCSIAPGVVILANVDHPTSLPSTFPFKTILYPRRDKEKFLGSFNFDAISRGPVKIGHDVWIGQNVIVLSGVNIGTGAVVGAGSLVAKDIPPYAIAVGNPAKVIRFRFPPEIVARLLGSEWWMLSDEKLIKLNEFLYDVDIDNFINQVAICKVSNLKNETCRST
ncbi:CatB-related O-acetyltransferase [Rhodoferax sp.]|uniref:CatB-related O-acetyltransferase n=1 Tax=Rhodoferax sp. TaxID=50421 RepID=UPI0025DBF803|nr:CatB-related O-acetyltransferase [Rhodoferax sp.]